MAVIGGVPSLAERGRADNVGPLYSRMADRGELLVSEGRKTPDVEGFIEVRYRALGRTRRGGLLIRYKEAELVRRFERGSGSGASRHACVEWAGATVLRTFADSGGPSSMGRCWLRSRYYSGARWPRHG